MFGNISYLSMSQIPMWKLRNGPSCYTHMGDDLQPAGCIWLCQAVPATLKFWRIIVQRKLETSKPMSHILEVLEFSTGLIIYRDLVWVWSTEREIAFESDSTIFTSLKFWTQPSVSASASHQLEQNLKYFGSNCWFSAQKQDKIDYIYNSEVLF